MYGVMFDSTTGCFDFHEEKFAVKDLHAADRIQFACDELLFFSGQPRQASDVADQMCEDCLCLRYNTDRNSTREAEDAEMDYWYCIYFRGISYRDQDTLF